MLDGDERRRFDELTRELCNDRRWIRRLDAQQRRLGCDSRWRRNARLWLLVVVACWLTTGIGIGLAAWWAAVVAPAAVAASYWLWVGCLPRDDPIHSY